MLDLHQGFTGDEAESAPATVSSLAVAQLEVASALSKGRFREAAAQQLAAWRLLGRVAAATVRQRFGAR
jgi:hypothetical protein